VPAHDHLPTYTSVEQDWRAWLPPEKSKVFVAYVQQLECRYRMFSVALNEAIDLHHAGLLMKSLQALRVASALSARLTEPLTALLGAFSDHAGHFGTAPSVAPLHPANFLSSRGQGCARISSLLSRVLLTQRSTFLHKIGDLQELVEDLERDFYRSVEALVTHNGDNPARLWEAAIVDHFDLNTCLRESLVLLKSFLRAIPEEQVSVFEGSVTTRMGWRSSKPAGSLSSAVDERPSSRENELAC
jgi:hypothetical protein